VLELKYSEALRRNEIKLELGLGFMYLYFYIQESEIHKIHEIN